MELVENLICCSTKYFGIKLVEQTSITIQFLSNRTFWQQQRRSIYSSSRWELFLFQLNFSFSQAALILSILPGISPLWLISYGVLTWNAIKGRLENWLTFTNIDKTENRNEETMNGSQQKISDVTYCLLSKTSFCSGRDWHDDRHRSISAVASFWLTGTILLVDGLPNLARRLLASTGFTAASKIARMKIILIAETIFMAIEIEIFRIICLIMKIMKILRRISHF